MRCGHFELQVLLRSGALGDLFTGEDFRTGEQVRILLISEPQSHPEEFARLAERARLLAMIANPAVIGFHDFSLDTTPAFVVFPVPVGEVLEESLASGKAKPEHEVLQIAHDLAGIIAESHRLGLVHGQIDATTVWLIPGNLARLDFGKCFLETDSRENRPRSEARDVQALGLVLYRLLHGEVPSPGHQLPPGRSLDEAVAFSDLVDFLLAPDEEDRPSSREVFDWLDSHLGQTFHQNDLRHTAESAAGSAVPAVHLADKPVAIEFDPKIMRRPTRQLGRYQILEKLGEGGLGIVYRGRDTVDGKIVALKVLHQHLVGNPKMARRFRKEARLLGSIDSPNVCKIYECNEDQGRLYLVLEFLEGQTLDAFLRRFPRLPERPAIALFSEVARALAEAHRRGIIHRDVKPDNIMLLGPWDQLIDRTQNLKDLRIKLCDFGLARHIEQSESLNVTRAGSPLGTPMYMAPEQARGGIVCPASDVYALGITMFQALAGQTPYHADSVQELLERHQNAPIPSLLERDRRLSDGLCQVVAKTMAKDPSGRYADAEELLLDLERLLRGEPTSLVVHPRLPQYDPKELISYDWTWELESTPEALWPLVSNTERLNRAVGVPAVTLTRRTMTASSPDLNHKVESIGAFRKAGFTNTWLEHPFEWIEGRRLGVLREYSEGVFRWFATTTELIPKSTGGTTLIHRVRIVPRGFMGKLVAAIEVGFKGKRRVGSVYQRIDQFLAGKLASVTPPDPFDPKPRIGKARWGVEIIDFLTKQNISLATAETLTDHILAGPEQEIARIRPIALAQRYEIDPAEVIDACLLCAREGYLELLWDILCPRCRVAASIEETLRNIRDHSHCRACAADFDLDFGSSVELIFRVASKIRTCELATYCLGGPAHSPHVAAQVRVGAGERLELNLGLPEGAYRLRGPQLAYGVDFRVHSKSPHQRGELNLKQGPSHGLPRTYQPGSQILTLVNEHAEEIVVRIERQASRQDALTAGKAMTLPRFRELFPHEILDGQQLVSLANVTLLVTDLLDADLLYRKLGDAGAFGVIHEQMRLVQHQVSSEGGALIKTINEGVVAAFVDPAAAVRVALDLQPMLSEQGSTADLRLRIGVHRGAAMVATFNDKLDYFGAVVHQALQLPRQGLGGDVLISQAVANDVHVQHLLGSRRLRVVVVPPRTLEGDDMITLRLMPIVTDAHHGRQLKRLTHSPIG